jgi:digeranylgeranylglycerophospholipid reductase
MHDVAVIGGGPGGLQLARVLAAEGLDVAIFEEHEISGEPVHCTGVLASDAFEEFDLPRASILNDLRTARFIAPSGHAIAYTTPALEAVAVDRLAFDRLLCESARNAGATLVPASRVTAVAVSDHGVDVTLSGGGTVRSRACVLACGANYALQQRLGMGIPPVFLQSAQLELTAARPGDVEVHFGRAVAPKGFAWVVPVRRAGGEWCARVGLMCERDAAGGFRRFLRRIQDRLGLDPDTGTDVQPRRKMLPLAPISRTYTDRVLAIGDAAGIVKATTGGGIYYSIVSANLAAEVLARALRRDELGARTLRKYEQAWRARLGPEIETQLELRTIAHRMDDGDIEALFELARTDGIMPIVRRTARFNHHRALIVALFRHPPARRALFDRLRPSRRRSPANAAD